MKFAGNSNKIFLCASIAKTKCRNQCQYCVQTSEVSSGGVLVFIIHWHAGTNCM